MLIKLPFLAKIKKTKEKKLLYSAGFGAKDGKGNFFSKSTYIVLKKVGTKEDLENGNNSSQN